MSDYQLPSTFEEFSEARRNGFLKAKAIKDAGGKIAGVFCTFSPCEIFDAADIHTVGLCGTSDKTIGAAESELPKNLCPLIKSSYGFALTQKCPYTYFADILIGETTCDGKKKMYEMLSELKDMHVMQLPQGVDRPYAKQMWTSEIHYLIEVLEKKFGVTITDEKLRKACAVSVTANARLECVLWSYRNRFRRLPIQRICTMFWMVPISVLTVMSLLNPLKKWR